MLGGAVALYIWNDNRYQDWHRKSAELVATREDLLAQGREIAHVHTSDPKGFVPNAAMTWGAFYQNGVVWANDMFQSLGRELTLKAIQQYEAVLTDEKLAEIQAEFDKIPAKE